MGVTTLDHVPTVLVGRVVTALIFSLLGLVWLLAAGFIGIVLGAVVRRRDEQVPVDCWPCQDPERCSQGGPCLDPEPAQPSEQAR